MEILSGAVGSAASTATGYLLSSWWGSKPGQSTISEDELQVDVITWVFRYSSYPYRLEGTGACYEEDSFRYQSPNTSMLPIYYRRWRKGASRADTLHLMQAVLKALKVFPPQKIVYEDEEEEVHALKKDEKEKEATDENMSPSEVEEKGGSGPFKHPSRKLYPQRSFDKYMASNLMRDQNVPIAL